MKSTDERDHVWFLVNQIHKNVFDQTEQALKKSNLPSLKWYDILWELDKADQADKIGLRQQELQKQLLFDQGNLSRTIKRMVDDHLVEQVQHVDDKRGRMISITLKGRDIRQQIWKIYNAHLQTLIGDRLANSEQAQLTILLEKLR